MGTENRYSVPRAMLADDGSFKEYLTNVFLRNQVDAIQLLAVAGTIPFHEPILWRHVLVYLKGYGSSAV